MGKSMNNLARSGIPFLVMLMGGIFTLQFFQKAKNEFGKKRAEVDLRRTVAGLGLCSKQPLEKFYKEYCESDTDNWENIRGPRAEEDNQEYVRAKERRQQEREARARTLMRATMEQK